MEKTMRVLTAILLSLSSVAAFAGDGEPPVAVSEPGMLALLAAAGVAALVLKRRGRK
ncbi:MAG TPA: PEP-CTERM sorting domain-containing protein [Quisquiliibacterium sp.]|nr:PEP-CTERM sorting domain-containing protein [Quisquiliibacterium sp.]